MQQSGPKTFISYCGQNQDLAQKLKEDLTRAGCDPWQFDLSATPGTDAWGAILERIENSDFFIVILSKAATTSRAVKEEIGHAHYCSINNSEGRPRIIPLTTEEDGITVPRQIVRQVRLPFRQIQYNSDFERLLSALGLEESPFASAKDLEVTISRGREFDVQREAEIFAAALIRQHPQVSSVFDKLSAEAAAGGRCLTPSPHALVWEDMIYRKSRQPQLVSVSESTILVFFPLRCKHTKGYESSGRVVLEIAAFGELKYDYVGDEMTLVLHSDTLRLKFEGFRDVKSGSLVRA